MWSYLLPLLASMVSSKEEVFNNDWISANRLKIWSGLESIYSTCVEVGADVLMQIFLAWKTMSVLGLESGSWSSFSFCISLSKAKAFLASRSLAMFQLKPKT